MMGTIPVSPNCDIVTPQALRQTASVMAGNTKAEMGLFVGGLFEGPGAAAMVLGAAATLVAFEGMVTLIGNEHFVLIVTLPEIQDRELVEDLLFWLKDEGAEIYTNI
jgi:hypothetical protein